jgi:hypothetical protein
MKYYTEKYLSGHDEIIKTILKCNRFFCNTYIIIIFLGNNFITYIQIKLYFDYNEFSSKIYLIIIFDLLNLKAELNFKRAEKYIKIKIVFFIYT